jgi:YggT family protein
MTSALLLTSIEKFVGLYTILIFVRLLLTWFPAVDLMQQAAGVLSPVTDPYLNIFRNIIPPLGNIDISPMLAILILQAVGAAISSIPKNVPLGF